MRRLFFAALIFASCAASAVPVDLSSALYTTSAFAEVGSDSDGINADNAPPTALPLFSNASVTGADPSVTEFAFGDAVADDGFLVVSSEVRASLKHAGAVAEASLAAELFGVGSYSLLLDFDNFIDLVGGEAGAVLGLTLSVGSHTLFDEIFTDSAKILHYFALAPGESGLLHVSLIGTADAFPAGTSPAPDLYGFNLASVGITLVAVPSPTPLALIGAALLPIVRLTRSRRVVGQV